jgi:hypothetical protein
MNLILFENRFIQATFLVLKFFKRMRGSLLMIAAFSSMWLVSVAATPVSKNLDHDFQLKVKEFVNLNK